MTRGRILFIFAGLAAVAAAVALYTSRDAPPPAEIARAPTSAAVPAPAPVAAAPVRHSSNADTAFTTSIGTRSRDPLAATFEATDDLLAFVEGIQDAAQGGDGRAAYYLSHALERCETEYGKRFGSGRRERPLDEVMTDASIVSQFGEADLRRIHGQCQRLRESDITRFGPADDWLLKAADAGYPRAQAEAALWFVNTGESAPGTDWSGQAREFARAAVSSKDPEVFLTVSRVIEGLNKEEAANLHPESSWYIAACLRGLDCGPGFDVIRRVAGERFKEIELGAHEINEAIDAGRFDELGL